MTNDVYAISDALALRITPSGFTFVVWDISDAPHREFHLTPAQLQEITVAYLLHAPLEGLKETFQLCWQRIAIDGA